MTKYVVVLSWCWLVMVELAKQHSLSDIWLVNLRRSILVS